MRGTAEQICTGGDKRSQVAGIERFEYKAVNLVDIWYDPPNKDTPGRRGPAQIVTVNDGEGNDIVRCQGEFLFAAISKYAHTCHT